MGPKVKVKRVQYGETAVEDAMRAMKDGKKGLRAAAKLYGVPHNTLRDRIRGKPPLRMVRRTALSPANEGKLVSWLEDSARRGFAISKKEILTTAQSIVEEANEPTPFKDGRPGDAWYKGFMKRHNFQSVKKHHHAIVVPIEECFNEDCKDIVAVDSDVVNHPEAERIFNCDENGFQEGGGISEVVEPQKYDTDTDTSSNEAEDEAYSPPPQASSSTFLDDISPLIALDRLIDLAARVGLDRVTQIRGLHTLKRKTGDPDQELFALLYDGLTRALKDTDNIRL